jgi:serine protease
VLRRNNRTIARDRDRSYRPVAPKLRRGRRAAVAALALLGSGLLAVAGAANAQAADRDALSHRTAAHVGSSINATTINLHQLYLQQHNSSPNPRVNFYQPGKRPKSASAPSTACAEPDCPLVYNGGSVQHTPHVYLLLWGPNWSTDANQKASASYLERFYRGLGVQPRDSWSTTTDQYGDGSGHPVFSGSVYKGAWQDTSTPPTGIDQTGLANEADAFATSRNITDLTDAQIVVATQSGTCPQGFGCSGGGQYCAWHTYTDHDVPFTNLPYNLDVYCGENYVNANGTDDGWSIVGGHEYAETITDPYPDSGWYDSSDQISGGEIGDKCSWVQPMGDVTLSSGSFAMQSLWSNSANACVLSTVQPTHTLSVQVTGAGTVTSSPAGISCGATCSANFPAGGTVKLTAAPTAGAVFMGWTGPCTGLASKTCVVPMNGDVSATATFQASSALHQESSATYSGSWTAASCACFSGGSTKRTSAANAAATFTFTGTRVAFVSERGPTRGSFRVVLDGATLTTVNADATSVQNAVVLWRHTFAARGTHTLKLVNLATSGHPRFDVDAFVVKA